ncbi:MAG: ABC transporter permease [Renibacterium salmoninarum]|nr:ABC transporter permease [Renibacterium salmoninarum]
MTSIITRPPVLAQETEQDLMNRVRANARNTRLRIWGLRAALVAIWLGSWEITANIVGLSGTFFISRPSLIWERLVQWFTVGTPVGSIWENIGYTVSAAVLGFILGTITGIVVGVFLGRNRFLAEVLAPFIKASNAIPRIVLAALFIIWFGSGINSKVATVFVLVFFVIFFNAFTGAREVDQNVINNARILGASKRKVLTSIVLPSATSWILSSMHTAFGFALIGAIVGEYAGAKRGMGLLLNQSQGSFDTAGIFAGMIIVTVIALLAEWILTVAENKLLKWKPSQSGSHTKGL